MPTTEIILTTRASSTRLAVCKRHEQILFDLPTTMSIAPHGTSDESCAYCMVANARALDAQTTLRERLSGLLTA